MPPKFTAYFRVNSSKTVTALDVNKDGVVTLFHLSKTTLTTPQVRWCSYWYHCLSRKRVCVFTTQQQVQAVC